jgi:hypothetical protein
MVLPSRYSNYNYFVLNYFIKWMPFFKVDVLLKWVKSFEMVAQYL